MTEIILKKLGLNQSATDSAGLPKSKTVQVLSRILHWKEKAGTVLYGLPLVFVFFAVWEIAPLTGIVSPIFSPRFPRR